MKLNQFKPNVADNIEDDLVDNGALAFMVVESEMCDIISKMLSDNKE